VLAGPQQINAGSGYGEAGSRTLVCVQPCKTSPTVNMLIFITARKAFILVSNQVHVLLNFSYSYYLYESSIRIKGAAVVPIATLSFSRTRTQKATYFNTDKPNNSLQGQVEHIKPHT
jgi:hypothetical protein